MKQKGQQNSQAHFISPLPIEECTRRLELLHSETMSLVIDTVTSDTVDFTVQVIERGRLRASGIGRLRRWEGTLTRVDCQVTIHEGIVRWMLVMALLMLMTLVLIPVIVLAATGAGALIWFGIGGFGIGMVMSLLAMADYYTPADDTPENVLAIIEAALAE